MKLTMLGTGGAFDRVRSNYHNNALLEIGDKRYLLDCSLYAFDALNQEHDLEPLDLDGVFLTHMHGDHVSGLEELGFRSFFGGEKNRPELYCHPNLLPSRQEGCDAELDLWENCLKAGMRKIQTPMGDAVDATLETYFEPHMTGEFYIDDGGERVRFFWVPTEHAPEMSSWGLIIEKGDRSLYFTGDSRPMWDNFYRGFDVILHDCIFLPYYDGTIHTHFEELTELPEDIQSRIHIMHYGDVEKAESKTEDTLLHAAKPGSEYVV